MQEWSLIYDEYSPEKEGTREALCTLGNGYFCTRGASPDSNAEGMHYPGTYIAGGYNRLVSHVSGRKVENEDLVNFPNWLPLTFRIDDGQWFCLDDVTIQSFRQELDLKHGVLCRDITFTDSNGKTSAWSERRIVSMANSHFAALNVRLTAVDWTGRLSVRSGLDGDVVNAGVDRYKGLADHHLDILELSQAGSDTICLQCRTNQSHLRVALAARTQVFDNGNEVDAERETVTDNNQIAQVITLDVERGASVGIEKVVAVHTSRDVGISEPSLETKKSIDEIGRFQELYDAHALVWRHLWTDCNIELDFDADDQTTTNLRINIFHLLQTVSPHSIELDTGVPARGWHGEAYRGHIFWDELFIFPFLTLRLPMLTRTLLLYRYRRLPEARKAARAAGYKGVMFPWQSGSDGREESQQLHLNPDSGRWVPDTSCLQRHINSAIAYNVWQYYQVTDDNEFLYFYGAELIIEIARFWASIATYNETRDRYEIKGVMGPDEFHTTYPDADPEDGSALNNNAYTNIMAAWVLDRARDVIDQLPRAHLTKLCDRIGLDMEECALWAEISRKLFVPFHDGNIISQFEGYGDLQEFDWEKYKEKYGDIQRLDRILEAEGDSPNNYKLSKQADVKMLFYVFSAEELGTLFKQLDYPFDKDTIPRNVEYYSARTSHGSTLSRVVGSWVHARSDRPQSWSLFQGALSSDLVDIQGGTTREGIHVGAMAGTLDIIQRCYLGVEIRANALYFDPMLPKDLRSMRAQLQYRRQVIEVEVTQDTLTITSQPNPASPITIVYQGHYRDVAPGDTYTFQLLKRSGTR